MTISSSKSKVCFFFETRAFDLRNRSALKAFIEAIFRREKKKLNSLNYIFTTDKRLLQINQDFLAHDDFTDIISFDLSESEYTEGEIYISIPRVKENAKKLGLPFKAELLRVIFHGALHLCGYKDKTRLETDLMRSKEDEYLHKFMQ